MIRDAGYEAVSAGGLENSRGVEDFLNVLFAVSQTGMAPLWYRFAPPESF